MKANQHAGFVAIVGRPNAGKSTLLNLVLGADLSIVTPKAQTTRERVLGILTESAQGGRQIVFVDTPGIHKAKPGGINEFMVNEAKTALEGPSVVWYLVDPTSKLEHEKAVLDLISQSAAGTPVFVVFNKIDLKGYAYSGTQFDEIRAAVMADCQARGLNAREFRLSAEKGKGLEELLSETWRLIPEHPFFYPDEEQMSDRPTRFFVAEKVREQLFRCLGDELPYSCAVEIGSFDEESKPPRIEAVIHVERESQKGMVIGKGGVKIKEIGSNARATVEEFLGHKIFLGLKVDVIKDWTKDQKAMKRMGYLLPEKPGAKGARGGVA
jgi:GTP-binding protein Era